MGRLLTDQQETEIQALAGLGWGGRRIAQAIEVPYGRVRRFLETEGTAQQQQRPPDELPPGAIRSVVWDLETTNLKSDIGTLLVAGFLDLNTGEAVSRTILDSPGGSFGEKERSLAVWARGQVERADILVGHNTLAFDTAFLNGVLRRNREERLPRRLHLDTLSIARYGGKWALQSNSLANLADFLGLAADKDRPSKHSWREANLLDPDAVERIRDRCEADLFLNAEVWHELRHAWFHWRGR